ncbi:RagB/SusD family nutrient uptake outer membrane protein, partial [Sphingobacterium multivorum]|uniref:RagB/SusD family nutrient uptake outer membrane protein n=1 Tax=Sphingobacterium multivorum TaxID=28454 RepID=UPI0028A0EC9E
MKKIVYIYALLSCGMMACSKDYLERLPESSVTPEASFKKEKDLALFTKSFYDAALPSAEGVYNESVDNIVKTTLDDELTGKRQVPISGGGWTWANLRNINYFLANCFNTVSETTAAPYAAEARFFRAYFYFDKLKRFGDVPWYDKVIDQNDEEQLKKARDPRTLVVSNILADLDYAIANLPATKSDEKVTKWTALALKSR